MSMQHRVAANRSWANTPDRAARTAPGRNLSPTGLEYWLARLAPHMAQADEETRRKAAENLRRAWYLELSAKGVKARQARSRGRRGAGVGAT